MDRSRSAPVVTHLITLALLATTLSGCALTRSFFGGALRADVRVAPDANLDSPVAVSFVVVHDKKLLERLMELPARSWFEQREQLLRDFPRQLQAWTWEWIPDQQVPPLRKRFKAGARGGLVFADYLTEGDHRARFDPYRPFRLDLDRRSLEVTFKARDRGPATPLEIP